MNKSVPNKCYYTFSAMLTCHWYSTVLKYTLISLTLTILTLGDLINLVIIVKLTYYRQCTVPAEVRGTVAFEFRPFYYS